MKECCNNCKLCEKGYVDAWKKKVPFCTKLDQPIGSDIHPQSEPYHGYDYGLDQDPDEFKCVFWIDEDEPK